MTGTGALSEFSGLQMRAERRQPSESVMPRSGSSIRASGAFELVFMPSALRRLVTLVNKLLKGNPKAFDNDERPANPVGNRARLGLFGDFPAWVETVAPVHIKISR